MDQNDLIESIFKLYEEKGYVSVDTIVEIVDKAGISLDDIDRICDKLLGMGVIIRDDADDYSDEEDEEYDRSRVDYDALYYKVAQIEPEFRPMLDIIRQIQPPQHREWKMLIPQAQNGNEYARQRLCEMYMRTVLYLAYVIHERFDVSIADTFQDGVIGLLKAIGKFNPMQHDTFPSYFPLWARQNIFRNMPFSPNKDIYFPIHLQTKLYGIYDLVKRHHCDLCVTSACCPNLVKQVASALECSLNTAKQYLMYFKPCDSIERLTEEFPEALSDYGISMEEYGDTIMKYELRKNIENALQILRLKERIVLERRYGLKDGKFCTLEEVGSFMHLTRERIRQIEAKAIKKLRASNKLPSCII